MGLRFQLIQTDPEGSARLGRLTTSRGQVETPTFMPVGTQATVKSLTPEQVDQAGARVLLANAYHLHFKPGEELVASMGGLHKFMNWPHHIITDSGGYQVFSLPDRSIDEEGVRFRAERKGSPVLFTPEHSIGVQQKLGADIIMAFDECVAYPTPHPYAAKAMERTLRWLERSKNAWLEGGGEENGQALFGIVQGSTFSDLRKISAEATRAQNLPGIAVGGLSVGEGLEVMAEVLGYTMPHLPADKPRYLMGVGLPEDVLEAVDHGVDMMDCVIPTKYARTGVAFTKVGRMRLDNARFRKDRFPIDTSCGCYACAHYSRAYIHHLLTADEILSATLVSLHNIHFYMEMMASIRQAISQNRFQTFKKEFLAQYFREGKKGRSVN